MTPLLAIAFTFAVAVLVYAIFRVWFERSERKEEERCRLLKREVDEETDRLWEELRRQNPRCFGPGSPGGQEDNEDDLPLSRAGARPDAHRGSRRKHKGGSRKKSPRHRAARA